MNKRSFATRKVYSKRPAASKSQKKSILDSGVIKKSSKTVLIWGLLVINIILVASLIRKIIIPANLREAAIVDGTSTSVQVLNGCGATGAANVFAEILRENRYNVVAVGNADSFDYEKSVVINRGQIEDKEVEKIASIVGVGKDRILKIESQTSQSDVDLIVGADYQKLRAFRKRR